MKRTFALSAALACAGCIGTKYVPAPAPPTPMPTPFLMSDAPSPGPGKTRLVLDVPNASATAFEVKDPGPDEPDDRALLPLCKAPCAVNLERGAHRIAFVSPSGLVGSENVVLGREALVLRERLGYVEPHTAAWLAGVGTAALGAFGLVGGFVMVGQGDGAGRDPNALRDVRAAGAVTLVASAAVLGVAWLLLHAGRTEIQPSAATLYPASTFGQ